MNLEMHALEKDDWTNMNEKPKLYHKTNVSYKEQYKENMILKSSGSKLLCAPCEMTYRLIDVYFFSSQPSGDRRYT